MIHFLSGLPRSGSTLLANILSQNPQLSCTGTSGLIDVMGGMVQAWETNPATKANGETKEDFLKLLKAVVDHRVQNCHGKILIDKSRGWPAPQIMKTMTEVIGQPVKIIATVRPIADCVTSFVKVVKPDDIDIFCDSHPVMNHLRSSYDTLKHGFETNPENFLFVEYDKLISHPQEQLDRIYDFLNLPKFVHNFKSIKNVINEDDEAWGIKGLHATRAKLKKTSADAKTALGKRLFTFFKGGEFWNGPDSTLDDEPHILTLSVDALRNGDIEQGEKLLDIALAQDPKDARAKFNKGWYAIRAGKLTEGLKLLDAGRPIQLFGHNCSSIMPRWEGQDLKGKTIILFLQGGFGDQIIGVRFAKNLTALGAKVVAAGSPELASIFINVEGVIAFIDQRAVGGCYHDYWIEALYCPVPLNLELNNISGKPYIPRNKIHKQSKKLRVGLRWEGQQAYEHEQHRTFDPSPLFKIKGATLVNLQRDGTTEIPNHLEKPCLDTWEDTKKVIEDLDLVVSSCTSVAHMSAAMGVPTFIVIPVIPYYIWAPPGDTSWWYNCVTLFRQEKFGDWDTPLSRVVEKIKSMK